MPRKRVQKEAPSDPLLAKLEQHVSKILDDPKSSVRQRQTAIQLGIKLALIKHQIVGDSDEGSFFD